MDCQQHRVMIGFPSLTSHDSVIYGLRKDTYERIPEPNSDVDPSYHFYAKGKIKEHDFCPQKVVTIGPPDQPRSLFSQAWVTSGPKRLGSLEMDGIMPSYLRPFYIHLRYKEADDQKQEGDPINVTEQGVIPVESVSCSYPWDYPSSRRTYPGK